MDDLCTKALMRQVTTEGWILPQRQSAAPPDLLYVRVHLCLRMVVGMLVALLHGWHKVAEGVAYALFGSPWLVLRNTIELGIPIPLIFAGAAAAVQFGGGLLLAFGLYTRVAGALIGTTMLVAIWLNLRFDGPHGELATLYAIAAFAFVVIGPGPISLDGLRRGVRLPQRLREGSPTLR